MTSDTITIEKLGEPEIAAIAPPPNNTTEGYSIAFFTNNYRPFIGGVPISVELFQRHLKRLGDRVQVYAPQYDGATGDGEEVRRLPTIRHFNNTDFSLPLPISFKPVMDFSARAFDIIHVHHPFLLGEMGMRLARQHRLPLVFTYHTQYEQYTHYVPMSQDMAARTILRHATEFCNRCDLIIAPTRDIQCLLRSRGVQTRIEVLPTGIELETYEDLQPQAVREELNLAPDDRLLIYVGRLAKEKNLPFLMRACMGVLRADPRAHLALAGEGKIRQDLELLAAAAGEASRRVHFLGSRQGKALRNVYAAGDLFVFASKTETQGMVIAEALGAGTPAIALDTAGIHDVIVDDENGQLLAGDADEDAFRRAVLDALSDPERLARWREGAHRAARELDMPILARRLHEHYAALKLLPNRMLRQETMSFGLIRNYFETVWEDLENWFLRA